ncbi:MAG TPA: DUF1656 domain-containing protein [Acetobacteraceae bacterium]
MISELNIYGMYVPPMLLWFGGYRFVWHRPLFDLALLVVLLGGVVAAHARWLPQ